MSRDPEQDRNITPAARSGGNRAEPLLLESAELDGLVTQLSIPLICMGISPKNFNLCVVSLGTGVCVPKQTMPRIRRSKQLSDGTIVTGSKNLRRWLDGSSVRTFCSYVCYQNQTERVVAFNLVVRCRWNCNRRDCSQSKHSQLLAAKSSHKACLLACHRSDSCCER